MDVVCVSPSSVQGPGRLHGTARLLLQYLNGSLKFMVDTPLSFLDIADCTAGHLLAARHGKPGERYVLNGASFSTRELIGLVARATGIERRVMWLPGKAAMAAAVRGRGGSAGRTAQTADLPGNDENYSQRTYVRRISRRARTWACITHRLRTRSPGRCAGTRRMVISPLSSDRSGIYVMNRHVRQWNYGS